jgi:transcription antitermination factor NusG
VPRVLGSPGIVDVVRRGNQPASVEECDIDALIRAQKSSLGLEPWPELLVGQPVAVVDGPLAGMNGSFVEFRNTCRLVISIELLQRCVLVHVERDWVIPVKPFARETQIERQDPYARVSAS